MKNLLTDAFKQAARDYSFLLDNGYPERPTLKLVGDRYRLTHPQRTVLFRGMTSTGNARSRQSKITREPKGKKLYVDGYNVLFTIMNYLLGKTVFISRDGFMRDSGGTYGGIEDETFFYKAVDLLFDFIKAIEVKPVIIYLDLPVSGSASHKNELERRMRRAEIEGEVVLAKPVDAQLKGKTDGIVATSDSGIIDAVDCRIFDLARRCLEKNYEPDIPDLGPPERSQEGTQERAQKEGGQVHGDRK